ncbi:maleylacetoacetate isomerase [Roseiarcus sp.]|uniref:maleylacetoacetate isomerase n=1 Tax=Roseiarcus sp. TaxID=1969460 RepID=UPI003F96E1F6
MKLYGYFRSSAAYRVRIALNLKAIAYEQAPVHLIRNGGEQHSLAYRARNPQALVPTLELDDGALITQSLAIIEYLDAKEPSPALLPADAKLAARVRAVALTIACDIHPINNLRVLAYLKGSMAQTQDAVDRWYSHWVREGGLLAVEAMIEGGDFCFGDGPTLADLCLIPQLYNARRFGVEIDDLPKCLRVETACASIPAFEAARPERQPDAA